MTLEEKKEYYSIIYEILENGTNNAMNKFN